MRRLLLLLPLAASAATTPRGLVVDNLTLAPPDHWRQGAMVVRAEVRNPTDAPQRVRVRYGTDDGYPSGLSTAEAELEVPAGGRSRCAIALPHARLDGSPRLVATDGSGRPTEVERLVEWRNWSNDYSPALYVSRSLSGERLRDQLGKTVVALKAAGKFGSGSSSGRYHGNDFSPRAARAGDFADPWPGDWRAYSPFSGVFVAERDLAELSSEAKAALRDYAAAGGCVFLVGAEALPAEFADAPFAAFAVPAAASPSLDSPALAAPGAARRCGLGLLATLPAEVAAPGEGDIDEETGAFVLRHVLRAFSVLDDPDQTTERLAGKSALAEGLGKPPVALFLLLLFAFSVLAGPVAIWLLARRNRRIHILWVLPAASAVFSAAILLSLLLREGVRPTVDLRGGVLLDQRAGRALSLSTASFYSPLTLGAVDLPADAAVEPAAPHRGGDLRQGRAARYGGWIAPRTPGGFHLATVRATPLRLDVREGRDGGAPEVVNAFGAPVERLWLLDSGGASWTARDLGPGATVALKRLDGPDDEANLLDVHSGSLRVALRYGAVPLRQDVLSRPELASRRFYVAVLPAAPFEPDPLPGRKAKRSGKTVVYGTY